MHLQGGLEILSDWWIKAVGKHKVEGLDCPSSSSDGSSNHTSQPSYSQNTHFVEENLVPIFACLEIVSTLFGHSSAVTSQWSDDPPLFGHSIVPHFFSSLHETRTNLNELSEINLQFIHEADTTNYSGGITVSQMLEQFELQTRLRKWLEAFEALLRSMSESTRRENKAAADLLKMHYTVAFIWLTTCCSAEETAFGACFADFETIVKLAEEFIDSEKEKFATGSNTVNHVLFELLSNSSVANNSKLRSTYSTMTVFIS